MTTRDNSHSQPSHEGHPLHSLLREHSLIGALASALHRFTEHVEQAAPDEVRNDLRSFVRLFTELADCVHHEKEENIVAPFLVRHGFDWDQGAIAEVRREHQQERYLIEVLEQSVSQIGEWSKVDLKHIRDIARELAEFQKRHLDKENTLWFPVIMARLDWVTLSQLARELESFDRKIERSVPVLDLTMLAEGLITRYTHD